jgi:nucleoside-triphosphatase
MNILLTGMPGVGKTTLIRAVIGKLDRPARGFTTDEIRESGRRRGFKITTLNGREGVLAHDTFKGPVRVSRYGVSTADLETIGVPAITPKNPDEILVIDEIGKMECASEAFKTAAWRALEAPNLVLGTIARKGVGFVARVKRRPDVRLFDVTARNRDQLVAEILRLLPTGGASSRPR